MPIWVFRVLLIGFIFAWQVFYEPPPPPGDIELPPGVTIELYYSGPAEGYPSDGYCADASFSFDPDCIN